MSFSSTQSSSGSTRSNNHAVIPIATGLNGANPSIVPSIGTLAYNSTDNYLYYGSNSAGAGTLAWVNSNFSPAVAPSVQGGLYSTFGSLTTMASIIAWTAGTPGTPVTGTTPVLMSNSSSSLTVSGNTLVYTGATIRAWVSYTISLALNNSTNTSVVAQLNLNGAAILPTVNNGVGVGGTAGDENTVTGRSLVSLTSGAILDIALSGYNGSIASNVGFYGYSITVSQV